MFALVGPVLLDLQKQSMIVRPACAHRFEHAVDRRIPAVLVVDVDRAKQVEIATPIPGTHARLGKYGDYRVNASAVSDVQARRAAVRTIRLRLGNDVVA